MAALSYMEIPSEFIINLMIVTQTYTSRIYFQRQYAYV